MSIIDDFKAYQDAHGMIQLKPGETSQNGQLWTAMSLQVMKLHGVSLTELRMIWAHTLDCTEVEKGVFRRSPGSDEGQSMDNYVGILLGSKVCEEWREAERIYQRGRETHYPIREIIDDHFKDHPITLPARIARFVLGWVRVGYCYPVKDPSKGEFFSWFGRSPGFRAIIKTASDVTPSFFEQLGYAVGQMISAMADKETRDAWSLGWCSYHVTYGRYWIMDLGNRFFRACCKETFKDNSLGTWLRVQEPGHPMAVHWKDGW